MKQENTRRNFIIVFLAICISFSMQHGIVFSQHNDAGQEMRDPFQDQLPEDKPPEEKIQEAPVEAPKPPPVIIVESLVSGGPVPQAIIKGKVLRVGDIVDGALIKNITKDGVEMLFEKQEFFSPAPSKLLKSTQGGKNVK
ncbi:MAG: hypothetical protein A2Y00_08305 [Omnitrophica WOR_2 bacterium GWF2_43_52]|nr:MAG: hypothetical protein A2062_02755 [Omnitrophica WOR_2 bacterium GWA2_44_7]OGX16093.1 MAG: hypothetical protein A2Y01_00435 [Omnitrophica WOR_2 bacterium GWC2_44_8]OGX21435.1 MAG: hypothetical protein A2Y00_08305 [Omnitrophica WOR_2 bacterium GWF2_43_52]HAH21935.1 hypothetical protein [Candidatus Omnitrophota bacterium]HBG64009.1 hypothetical protein [Candidatus Omnitrophota bacterium]